MNIGKEILRPTLRPLLTGRIFRKKGALDPVVEAYQVATGIANGPARQINTMLKEARACGAEPAFMWVGGSAYNQADQRRAVIGGLGTVVGAKASPSPVGELPNACRFNRGKFLRFDNPATLRAVNATSVVVMVWAEVLSSDNDHHLCNSWETGDRGPMVQIQGNGNRIVSIYPNATAVTPVNIRSYGAAKDILRGVRPIIAHLKKDNLTKFFFDLQDGAWAATPTVYNNNPYLKIGGRDESSVADSGLSNCYIHAVIVAPDLTDSLTARARAAGIPYSAGMLQPSSRAALVTIGDSTTAIKWNGQIAAEVNGGAWRYETAVGDLALFGTSLDYHISKSDDIVAHLNAKPWGNRFFYYCPEDLLAGAATALGIPATFEAWTARTLEFLLDIEARTGAQIIVGSYIKGNVAAPPAVVPYNEFFEAEAAARGWYHVPFYDDPHSQVYTGAVPGTYGFYTDAIHQSANGIKVQAEVFAAAVPHPSNTAAPRANLATPPTLSGTQASGQTLTCAPGTWHNSPTGYTYQWLRNLADIAGATSSTYVLQAGDVGNRVACRVTATKAGQNSASFTTAPTGPIA